jgi:uncharacterized protein (DUF488 family)
MKPIKLFTVGFTKKSARTFFTMLCDSGVTRVIDIRLHNTSQLAGFAKQDDLCYFLKAICDIAYSHEPEFAPTQGLMDAFKKNRGDWSDYERDFLTLLEKRQPEKKFAPDFFDHACLLCSEEKPDHCHRLLVARYLKSKWNTIDIVHLV